MSNLQDNVNRPKHYTQYPIECIEFTGHRFISFSEGNAFKYVFRAGSKNDLKEDLCKAEYYLNHILTKEDYMQYFVTPTDNRKPLLEKLASIQSYFDDANKYDVLYKILNKQYREALNTLRKMIDAC